MKEIFTKHRRLRLLAAAAVLLALAALWALEARPKDTYAVWVPGGYYVGDYENDTQGDYAGQLIAEFCPGNLVAGDYTLYIPYQTEQDGSRFEVLDPDRCTLLAQGTYPAGQQGVTVHFSKESGQTHAVIRSYQGSGRIRILGYNLVAGTACTDTFWILALAGLFGLFCVWCLRRHRAGHTRDLQLLLIAGAFSLPYLSDHLPFGHDMAFHLSRILGLGMALRGGQFPVRLNLDFMSAAGGYISSIMYPELFLYPGGVMCAMGASALLAVKVLLILIAFLTAYCAYYGARQMLGDEGGMLFTLLYMCCPYRLTDVYVRAALGEALAMAFLPLAAAGIWQLMQGDCKKGFWTAMLGISGVLQSHVITMFLVVVFGGLYAIAVLIWQGRHFWTDAGRPGTLLAAAAATVGINLWFLAPFLHFSSWDLRIFHDAGMMGDTGVYLWQVFMDSYSTKGDLHSPLTKGEMSFSVGFALLAAILFILYRFLKGLRPCTQEVKMEGGALALGSIALFMASSLFPWARVSDLALVQKTFAKLQFAWRFLMIVSVLYCLAAAIEICLLYRERRKVWAGALCVLAVMSALNAGSHYYAANDAYLQNSSSDWKHDEVYDGQYILSAHVFNSVVDTALEGVVPLTDGAEASDAVRGLDGLSFRFTNSTGTAAEFRVPQYNYTLHKAFLSDGQELAVTSAPDSGLIVVTVPAGAAASTVEVRYHEPLRFRLAEGISLLTAAALVLLRRHKHRRGKVSAAPLAGSA